MNSVAPFGFFISHLFYVNLFFGPSQITHMRVALQTFIEARSSRSDHVYVMDEPCE